MSLDLRRIKKWQKGQPLDTPEKQRLAAAMSAHYSQPGGFPFRALIYEIWYDGVFYGHIVGGSATKHLPNRPNIPLNNIINNTFYHIEPHEGRYPIRNFTTYVLESFMAQAAQDWEAEYKDPVYAFETLVEPPRTGELYRRAGFQEIGMTQGWSCKRGPGPRQGEGEKRGGGKRIWTKEADPECAKIVLWRWWVDPATIVGAKKLPYLGQCDRVRCQGPKMEAFWQEMMRNKEPVTLREIEAACDVSAILDEGERLQDFVEPSDHGYFKSHVNGKPAWFVSSAGFEFIFADPPGESSSLLGYKVMRLLGSKLVSGADARISYPAKTGTVIKADRKGVFLSPNKQYVLDYYAGHHDNEALVTLSFEPSHIKWGNLSDRESEVGVSEATIIDITPLNGVGAHEVKNEDEARFLAAVDKMHFAEKKSEDLARWALYWAKHLATLLAPHLSAKEKKALESSFKKASKNLSIPEGTKGKPLRHGVLKGKRPYWQRAALDGISVSLQLSDPKWRGNPSSKSENGWFFVKEYTNAVASRGRGYDAKQAADAAEGLLLSLESTHEVRGAKVGAGEKYIDIYKNPSVSELRKLWGARESIKVRALASDSDFYLWDAYTATHYEAAKQLGVVEPFHSGAMLYTTLVLFFNPRRVTFTFPPLAASSDKNIILRHPYFREKNIKYVDKRSKVGAGEDLPQEEIQYRFSHGQMTAEEVLAHPNSPTDLLVKILVNAPSDASETIEDCLRRYLRILYQNPLLGMYAPSGQDDPLAAAINDAQVFLALEELEIATQNITCRRFFEVCVAELSWHLSILPREEQLMAMRGISVIEHWLRDPARWMDGSDLGRYPLGEPVTRHHAALYSELQLPKTTRLEAETRKALLHAGAEERYFYRTRHTYWTCFNSVTKTFHDAMHFTDVAYHPENKVYDNERRSWLIPAAPSTLSYLSVIDADIAGDEEIAPVPHHRARELAVDRIIAELRGERVGADPEEMTPGLAQHYAIERGLPSLRGTPEDIDRALVIRELAAQRLDVLRRAEDLGGKGPATKALLRELADYRISEAETAFQEMTDAAEWIYQTRQIDLIERRGYLIAQLIASIAFLWPNPKDEPDKFLFRFPERLSSYRKGGLRSATDNISQALRDFREKYGYTSGIGALPSRALEFSTFTEDEMRQNVYIAWLDPNFFGNDSYRTAYEMTTLYNPSYKVEAIPEHELSFAAIDFLFQYQGQIEPRSLYIDFSVRLAEQCYLLMRSKFREPPPPQIAEKEASVIRMYLEALPERPEPRETALAYSRALFVFNWAADLAYTHPDNGQFLASLIMAHAIVALANPNPRDSTRNMLTAIFLDLPLNRLRFVLTAPDRSVLRDWMRGYLRAVALR